MNLKKIWAGNNIILVIVAVILAAGCGLKGNPVPSVSSLNSVQDDRKLSAKVKEGAVELTWLSPKGNYSHVKIEKSELGKTGEACRECPRAYTGIADLTLNNDSRFIDNSVESGKSYSYRLNWCEDNGICRPSQTADVDVK